MGHSFNGIIYTSVTLVGKLIAPLKATFFCAMHSIISLEMYYLGT